MAPNTDRKLLAPLAGAALLAVLAIPFALGFVALTAGREDAARDVRLMSAAVAGYLTSITDIERHRLAAASASASTVAGRAMVIFNRQSEIIDRSGDIALNGNVERLARGALEGLKAEEASPRTDGAYSTLSWTGHGANIVVAVRDPLTQGAKVGIIPITPGLLNAEIGEPLGLRNVDIRPQQDTPKLGTSQAHFDVGGGGHGFVSWRTDDMNTIIFERLAPIMLTVAAILAALGVWLFRRTRRLTQEVLTSQARAKHLAFHDPLTGLANRALLTNRADLALEQRRREGGLLAFYALDLDQFKQVNDTLGHAAGDRLIRLAAARLSEVSRTVDTAARMGGDEFALVAAVSSQEDAEAIARRIVAALSGPVDLPGGKAQLSVSVGVTLVGTEPIDSAEALRQADLALYRAKAEGRGRFSWFEPAMDESLRLRRQTETDLRGALEAGALEVHYQPQVTTRTSHLRGVEALVRWVHPERGSISPAYFIPIAEESGLIHPLGDFVLRRACEDSHRWPGIKVAINISPCQLRTAGFAARCRAIVDQANVLPTDIELEITEGVLMNSSPDVLENLRTLREMGFTIALDDFGTGYSSLSYLNVYAVDKIKIDRSFIDRIGAGQDSEKVIRAIIRLSKALGLTVIAEGVETETQRAELASSGCGLIQGYLHAGPAEPEVIDDMMRVRGSAKAA